VQVPGAKLLMYSWVLPVSVWKMKESLGVLISAG